MFIDTRRDVSCIGRQALDGVYLMDEMKYDTMSN